MDIVMAVAAPIILMPLLEYVVHRWWQHWRNGPDFHAHVVEHHGRGENADKHLFLGWSMLAKVWIICAAGLIFVSWWSPLIFAVVIVWWKFTWSECHRIAHDLGGRRWLAVLLCPWTDLVVQHHLAHHRHPNRNFGAIFCGLFDTIFHTIAKESQ
jgi:Fatty acid hydroxylase superfamily